MTVYLLYAVGIGLWTYFAKGWMMKLGGSIPIAIAVNLFISKVLRKGGGKSGYQ
jgi:hypothetical protein